MAASSDAAHDAFAFERKGCNNFKASCLEAALPKDFKCCVQNMSPGLHCLEQRPDPPPQRFLALQRSSSGRDSAGGASGGGSSGGGATGG